MTKAAFFLAFVITALAGMPAHAQRVFVSGHGLDTNPCTEPLPCRTFQQAYNNVAANGEINVLDPAGYGPLTITHGISIQAHGWGGITQSSSCAGCAAITIAVTSSDFTTDPVTLNGLLLDGAGTGLNGINITSSNSVQILNSVVRNFGVGINEVANTNNARVLIEDTVVSDNRSSGINVAPSGTNAYAALSRITANNNQTGVVVSSGNATIANSVVTNNRSGVNISGGVVYLAKTVITANNQIGLNASGGVNTYGDNYVGNNGRNVIGTLNSFPTL